MDVKRQALAARIRAVFAGNERPPRDQIALHQCAECEELRASFANVEWQAMPDALIESHADSLVLLSPEAFHYFLPAYLLYALEHVSWRNTATEMTVYAIAPNPTDDEEHLDDQRARFKPLSSAEGLVLGDFLALLEQDTEYCRYLRDLSERRATFHALWESRWAS